MIILDTGRVTYQGPSSGIKEDAAQVRQIYLNRTVPDESAESLEDNKIVQGQALGVTETMADLTRSTGDFSLYGKVII